MLDVYCVATVWRRILTNCFAWWNCLRITLAYEFSDFRIWTHSLLTVISIPPTWRRGSMPSSITSVHLMYICEAGVRKCVWRCEFLFHWVQGRLHPLPSTPPCVAISVPSGATQASNGTYGVMHSHGDNDLMLFCVWNIFTVAISFRWCRVFLFFAVLVNAVRRRRWPKSFIACNRLVRVSASSPHGKKQLSYKLANKKISLLT